MEKFIRIGENLNVMSKTLGPAMKERNPGPIQEMAKNEAEKGVDYIDLNIGPARKEGDKLLDWLVNTIQEVTDLPLALDSTNMEAMEAGLKACKKKALINSVSLQTSRIDRGLELAAKYEADVIALLWSDQGMPRDANERAMHIVDFMQKATIDFGIPIEKLWFDPIVTPVSVEVNQVKACIECMGMLKDIAPGAKSTCGISNVSNGVPDELRHWLNITYLIMLMGKGLHSAIVDAFDDELLDIVSGKKQNIVNLVNRLADGEKIDMGSLNDEEARYAKTVRVLTGESLFSNSWLEI